MALLGLRGGCGSDVVVVVKVCLTHVNILHRCPRCGQCMVIHPVDRPAKMAYMVHNLMGAVRRRRKMGEVGKVARATEFAGWVEDA